jgi:biofilm PGA synthesis N-glycosyltransferase PgaC
MRLHVKFLYSIFFSTVWFLISFYLSINWIQDLATLTNYFIAFFVITAISFIPGIALSFVGFSMYVDKRPEYKLVDKPPPPVSILIAAYNEEDCIYHTLKSIWDQIYQSPYEIIVIDDGSKDKTSLMVDTFVKNFGINNLTLIRAEKNIGKANALNLGLEKCKYDLVITIDADSTLHKSALVNLLSVMVESDEMYGAVAGTIFCKNSNESFWTNLQYWDYLLGISSVKRIQSMYQGTLVAQGAFSVYQTQILKDIGGWPNKIGEDIVLTWDILSRDYKVGHAENAICFTNVPITYKGFYTQRKRWSRGLVEAFSSYPQLLFKKRKSTFFVWYNLLFPYIDFVYLFIFFPGVLAAIFFDFYLIAGLMTIIQLPLAIFYNITMVNIQQRVLKSQGIKIPKNAIYYTLIYILIYQLIMCPATLDGYVSEVLKRKRIWRSE